MNTLVSAVMGIAIVGSLPLAANDAKIHAELWRALTVEENATAPFFIVFGEKPDLRAARSTSKTDRAGFVARDLQETASRSQAGVLGYLRGRGVQYTPFWVENKISVARGDLELARDMGRLPMVVALIPEAVYALPPVQTAGDVGVTSIEWNIARIHADQVWTTYGTQGGGMVVANIDTGVQYTHPALAGQYRGNNGGTFSHAGNWYDPARRTSAPTDTNGHGTHTMGTTGGTTGGAARSGWRRGRSGLRAAGARRRAARRAR